MLSALVNPADAVLCMGFLFCFGGCHLYTPFLFCSSQQAPSSGCPLPHSRAPPSPGGELLHVSAPTQGCPLDHLACIPGPVRLLTMERQCLADCHPHSIAQKQKHRLKYTQSWDCLCRCLGLRGRLPIWHSPRGQQSCFQGMEASGHHLCAHFWPCPSSPVSSSQRLTPLSGPWIFVAPFRGHLYIAWLWCPAGSCSQVPQDCNQWSNSS